MLGPHSRFTDRTEAGQALAALLEQYTDRPDVVVLGLPRGGVPVAAPVAAALGAPLDVFVVRKLGVPGHEELAMGAVATGGVRVLDEEVLRHTGVSAETVERVTTREQHELVRREATYRAGRPPPNLAGRTVILVDDGLATGSTMRAAVRAARGHAPERIVVAVPVGADRALQVLADEADEVISVLRPTRFRAVGSWYDDFSPTTDEEVRAVLANAAPG